MKKIFLILIASNLLILLNAQKSIEITYIANEGFLIKGKTKKILIDGIFTEGWNKYHIPDPDSDPEALLKTRSAQWPFDSIDVLLFTHDHPDHINPEYVSENMMHNKKSVLICPSQVRDLMESVGNSDKTENRIMSVTPEYNKGTDTVIQNIKFKIISLPHADDNLQEVQNIGYIFTIDGINIFHAGDAAPNDTGYYQHTDIDKDSIDIAFLPRWFFDNSYGDKGKKIIRYINPKVIIIMHLPVEEYIFYKNIIKNMTGIPPVYFMEHPMKKQNFISYHDTLSTFLDSPFAYFKQTIPSDLPTVFAAGDISTSAREHSAPAFSPDGKEIYWSVIKKSNDSVYQQIMFTKFDDGSWTKPALAPFSSGQFYEGGPVISSDGNRLYIYRGGPASTSGRTDDINIICYTRQKNEWVEPVIIGKGVFHSVTDNKTIYYTDRTYIVRMAYKNNSYQTPEILDEKINKPGFMNWTPYIAPNESYLIFSRLNYSGDYGELMIAFHNSVTDTWSEPICIGPEINTWSQERFPSVSPDGRYLFFTRWISDPNDDIFWVTSSVIDSLKNKALIVKTD